VTAYSITGDDSLILLAPSLVANLFVLRYGTQGFPQNILLHGSIDLEPEISGIVYTYPYHTVDYVVSRSDQVCSVPMALQGAAFLDAFKYAGQAIPLAEGYKAPTTSDQVWQLVRDGILELRRIRAPVFFDSDGTQVDFVPLPVRPKLVAKIVDGAVVVGRNIDDGVAQKIRGYSLTPAAARLTKTDVIADAGGQAVFPIVRSQGSPYAQFRFSIIDATHSDLIIDTGGYSRSVSPDPWTENPPPTPPPLCATPVLDPASGVTDQVTITCATPGAVIHYTTNGVDPTISDPVYTTPLLLTVGLTVKAMAEAVGYTNSGIATGVYLVQAPDISQYVNSYLGPELGQPWGPLEVQLMAAVDAEVTVVIQVPAQYSTPSGQTITLVWAAGDTWPQQSEVLTVVSTGPGVFSYTVNGPGLAETSGTFEHPFILPLCETPVFDPPPGVASSVTITCATPGAEIYYTTDGTTPTVLSNYYTGPIPITLPITLKAMAIAYGYDYSFIATGPYYDGTSIGPDVFTLVDYNLGGD
jgi:hypothetical protein